MKVPAFLPDTPEVRGDILDYYFAVQRYDRATGDILRQIEDGGAADNTLLVVTSDNGMPFPRPRRTCTNTRHAHAAGRPLARRLPKGGRRWTRWSA